MENVDVNNKSKIVKLMIIVICLIVIALVGTYALTIWRSQENTELTLRIGDISGFYCTKGDNIEISNIGPIFDYTIDGESTTFSVDNQTNESAKVTVKFNITTITDNLKEESFKYVLMTNTDNSSYTVYTEGNFKDVTSGSSITLLDNYEVGLSSKISFKLVIYIDGNMENPITMQGGSLVGNLDACKVKLDKSGANSPALIEGLIPVMYDESMSSWVKADVENSNSKYRWYDYDNKKWANAVLVKENAVKYIGGQISNDKIVNITSDSTIFAGIKYVVDDNIGMYSLDNVIEISISQISTDFDAIKKDNLQIFVCEDLVSTSCTTMYEIVDLSENAITKVNEYILGQKTQASVRNEYFSATVGTPIRDSTILAFYVWIPRYKYKVWNKDKIIGTDSYDAYNTGIDIVFEDDTSSTGTISCTYSFEAPSSEAGSPNEVCIGSNGDYYTHPAFTFGTQELKGFWIGKFELSSESSFAKDGGGESTELTPRILPNVFPWTSNLLSNYWKVIYDMQKTNNIYGLSTSRATIDSHVITNMEWGAVAFLTNSKYGRCTDNVCEKMSSNNYGKYIPIGYRYEYMTGCGPIESGNTSDGTPCNDYKTTLGQTASTTGNIYGVYDMSGGTEEYVMGNMSSANGTTYTYNGQAAGTNFTYNIDTSKYLIAYAYGTKSWDQTAFNRGKLGDATSENVIDVLNNGVSEGWYGSGASMFYAASAPWLTRGGYIKEDDKNIFEFGYDSGASMPSYSTRAILAPLS